MVRYPTKDVSVEEVWEDDRGRVRTQLSTYPKEDFPDYERHDVYEEPEPAWVCAVCGLQSTERPAWSYKYQLCERCWDDTINDSRDEAAQRWTHRTETDEDDWFYYDRRREER